MVMFFVKGKYGEDLPVNGENITFVDSFDADGAARGYVVSEFWKARWSSADWVGMSAEEILEDRKKRGPKNRGISEERFSRMMGEVAAIRKVQSVLRFSGGGRLYCEQSRESVCNAFNAAIGMQRFVGQPSQTARAKARRGAKPRV